MGDETDGSFDAQQETQGKKCLERIMRTTTRRLFVIKEEKIYAVTVTKYSLVAGQGMADVSAIYNALRNAYNLKVNA